MIDNDKSVALLIIKLIDHIHDVNVDVDLNEDEKWLLGELYTNCIFIRDSCSIEPPFFN